MLDLSTSPRPPRPPVAKLKQLPSCSAAHGYLPHKYAIPLTSPPCTTTFSWGSNISTSMGGPPPLLILPQTASPAITLQTSNCLYIFLGRITKIQTSCNATIIALQVCYQSSLYQYRSRSATENIVLSLLFVFAPGANVWGGQFCSSSEARVMPFSLPWRRNGKASWVCLAGRHASGEASTTLCKASTLRPGKGAELGFIPCYEYCIHSAFLP